MTAASHQVEALARRVTQLEQRVERLDQVNRYRMIVPAVGELVDFIADEFSISATEIYARRRLAEPTAARDIVAWLARHLTGYSLPQIGRALGGRDHSTIISAVKRVEEAREKDPAYRRMTDELRTRAETFLNNEEETPDAG